MATQAQLRALAKARAVRARGKGKGTKITRGKHKGEERYTTKKHGVRREARKAYMK